MAKDTKTTDDKVWVTISGTVNFGNYESGKIEMGYNKTYGEENPIQLIDEITTELEDLLSQRTSLLKRAYKKTKKKRKPKRPTSNK